MASRFERYYHSQHAENVELIAQQEGQALSFYKDTFGPNQFEQVRMVEFVYYDGMVFSEDGTLQQPIRTLRPVLTQPQMALNLVLDELPAYAAVDPNYRLPSAYLQDHIKPIRPSRPDQTSAQTSR
ncbi:MAG: hypothetical protein F6J97_26540 [Leptolyngbya sp. SIO4C1]|nr:hypothetical protein [Leptolyngbya sp. SIO4C1]